MDPILLGVIGLVSLLLAHLVLQKGTQTERNRFSARAVVHPNESAILEYTPPHPPHGNVNAVPTITRLFNNPQLETGSFVDPRPSSEEDFAAGEGSSISSALPMGKPMHTGVLTSSSKERIAPLRATSAPPRPPSRGLSVPPAPRPEPPPIPPLNSSAWSRDTSRAATPSRRGEPGASAPTTSASSVKGKPSSSSTAKLGPLTRSFSAMSVPGAHPPTPSSTKSRSSLLVISKRNARKCAKNARFLNVLPNGERPETAYFRSEGRKSLDEPPMEELLKKRPPLRVGDLYCHTTPSVTQIWIYLEAQGKTYWEEIDVGYVRKLDGRMLSLTDGGKPNFVGDDWANKRQAKEERRKNKGKARVEAEVVNDESDELESEDD